MAAARSCASALCRRYGLLYSFRQPPFFPSGLLREFLLEIAQYCRGTSLLSDQLFLDLFFHLDYGTENVLFHSGPCVLLMLLVPDVPVATNRQGHTVRISRKTA